MLTIITANGIFCVDTISLSNGAVIASGGRVSGTLAPEIKDQEELLQYLKEQASMGMTYINIEHLYEETN